MLAKEYNGVDFHLGTLKVFFCGKCLVEMEAETKRDTSCGICNKHGWNVTYKCSSCGRRQIIFRQNPNFGEQCYSCP